MPALMRGYSTVDDAGKIPIPSNIRRMMGLEPGTRVEIRLTGPHQRPWIVVHQQGHANSKVRTTLPAIPVTTHS